MEMYGGHFGGSLDGILIGLMEAPKTWHNLEMKTHNDKSFKALVKDGVEKAKPEHFIQMQTYMGMSHEQVGGPVPVLDRSYYLAVNKNTDELYGERLHYDGGVYLGIKEKVRRIVFAVNPPPKMWADKEYFQCKWCDFKDVCHGTPADFEKPHKNCRTCLYSTPTDDGYWRCEKFDKKLCAEEQRAGCEKHLFIPQLLPWKQVDVNEGAIVYDDDSGNTITNYAGGELVKITKRVVDERKTEKVKNNSNLPPWAVD
jgi:hypothetical protein